MNPTEPNTRFALTPRMAMSFAALFAFCSLSYSQTPEPPAEPAAEPTAPSTQSAPVPDEKMDQFADAYVAVEGIQTQAAQQITSAADEESANAVKVNAETQMIKAVERTGLKVEEFNEIVQAMTSDPELRTKVVEKIEQRRGG